jgi:hypothetical protein
MNITPSVANSDGAIMPAKPIDFYQREYLMQAIKRRLLS